MNTLLKKHSRKLTALIIIALFSTSLWQLASAGWIQGKAIIAQQLLKYSWQQTLIDTNNKSDLSHKPWPWADTWPVAKLIIPQHKIEQIVLAGDAGNSLAFAPGYSLSSAMPNSSGTTVISAHRDTHFNFLKDIKLNEKITLQTVSKTQSYLVYDFRIVDSTDFRLYNNSQEQTLVLVTCYPFDGIVTGGPLRYLVFARAINSTLATKNNIT